MSGGGAGGLSENVRLYVERHRHELGTAKSQWLVPVNDGADFKVFMSETPTCATPALKVLDPITRRCALVFYPGEPDRVVDVASIWRNGGLLDTREGHQYLEFGGKEREYVYIDGERHMMPYPDEAETHDDVQVLFVNRVLDGSLPPVADLTYTEEYYYRDGEFVLSRKLHVPDSIEVPAPPHIGHMCNMNGNVCTFMVFDRTLYLCKRTQNLHECTPQLCEFCATSARNHIATCVISGWTSEEARFAELPISAQYVSPAALATAKPVVGNGQRGRRRMTDEQKAQSLALRKANKRAAKPEKSTTTSVKRPRRAREQKPASGPSFDILTEDDAASLSTTTSRSLEAMLNVPTHRRARSGRPPKNSGTIFLSSASNTPMDLKTEAGRTAAMFDYLQNVVWNKPKWQQHWLSNMTKVRRSLVKTMSQMQKQASLYQLIPVVMQLTQEHLGYIPMAMDDPDPNQMRLMAEVLAAAWNGITEKHVDERADFRYMERFIHTVLRIMAPGGVIGTCLGIRIMPIADTTFGKRPKCMQPNDEAVAAFLREKGFDKRIQGV